MQLAATNECEQYLIQIEQRLASLYDIAKEARSKGLDPSFEPESRVVRDLGEMVEGLVGPPKIAERIRELSKMMGVHEMAFVVASEIVLAKFGQTDPEEAAEQAIRTSLAIMTGGITAAPIQGISRVRIRQNPDRSRHLAIYYAGPIRSAAGTEQALTLVIGDFVRRRLGLDRYRATEDEVRRFIEEVRLYEREVKRFQYHVSDEELANALRNLPVECTGMETDRFEVSSFRSLPRVETNRLRGGALLVVNDGVVGRAQKVLRIIDTLGVEGWDWLRRVKESGQEAYGAAESTYMEDVIAGRPIFAFPSREGGFRLRYGRSRNTGLAALGVHPATMTVLGNFLASGTQIRVEGPGKGGVVLPVDTLEPAVVKLRNGSVVRVETVSEATKLGNEVETILFLGDLLVAFGEFLENNKPLAPSGYTEEWWAQEVQAKLRRAFGDSLEKAAETVGISIPRLEELLESPLTVRPTAQEALAIAKRLEVPLHPRFTYFWRNIKVEELSDLRRALSQGEAQVEGGVLKGMTVPLGKKVKDVLERLCVPHEVHDGRIVLRADALILANCLQTDDTGVRMRLKDTVLNTVSALSGIALREKGLTYVGARMGRPEKARRREMSPLVHVLFPVGLAGGSQRNIVMAAGKGPVQVEVARRRCSECGAITHRLVCPRCGAQTALEMVCPRCNRVVDGGFCPTCRTSAVGFGRHLVNVREVYEEARASLGRASPNLVKGVRGLTSATKTPELLQKGILRARHGLSVFKDGTVRFDATNAPLTHFRPVEVDAPIEELRRLGYVHDMEGNPLQDPNQMCELKVQDVILSRTCAQYLVNAARFIDELLQKVYSLPPYYNVERERDLIGHLVVGFAPHTSAGVIGRVVGFTEMHVCYAHPLWHNIKRRDCDGDEDAVMLVLDVLLNFSKAYLPGQIGGMMDAPLLLISVVDPFEVDEAHNVDVAAAYPLEFYEKTLEHADPKVLSKIVDLVQHRLGTPAQFEGYAFTHQTFDINEGNRESAYIRLGAMKEKLRGQLLLAEKIRAVDPSEVARRVLNTHLIRDIAGNLKAFTKQRLRCKKCNAKYRRAPLSGKCSRCGGDLLLTVHRKGIEKYLGLADELVKKYDLGPYYQQRMELLKDEIRSLFMEAVEDRIKQVKLGEFM